MDCNRLVIWETMFIQSCQADYFVRICVIGSGQFCTSSILPHVHVAAEAITSFASKRTAQMTKLAAETIIEADYVDDLALLSNTFGARSKRHSTQRERKVQ